LVYRRPKIGPVLHTLRKLAIFMVLAAYGGTTYIANVDKQRQLINKQDR